MSSPSGQGCAVAGKKEPGFRPSRGSVFLELCSWPGSGQRREDRGLGGRSGCGAIVSVLELGTWPHPVSGAGRNVVSCVPRKRREGGLETCPISAVVTESTVSLPVLSL